MTKVVAHDNIPSAKRPMDHAILSTLAYSDIFDYPLRLEELHNFLVAKSNTEELQSRLKLMNDNLANLKGYYFLPGREAIVELRLEREARLRKGYKRAFLYGWLIGYLPFVRMVGLTGSLALRNCSAKPDFDFFLLVKEGRVWTARLFILVLNRITRLFGDVLCPNIIISEKKLEWPEKNIYTAREIAQMVVLSGQQPYLEFRKANSWAISYLPNSMIDNHDGIRYNSVHFMDKFKLFVEKILSGRLGDRFESWELERKRRRLNVQFGFGRETGFDADRCWGNFNHHGVATLASYDKKMKEISTNQ